MDYAILSKQTLKNTIRAMLRAISNSRLVYPPLLALSRADLLPKAVRVRLPVERVFRCELPGDKGFFYESSYADVIGRALYWGSGVGYERQTVLLWYEMAKTARLVLDVGANTGVYSLVACAANDRLRVVAFEPVPSVLEQFTKNMSLNGWEDRCEARPEAVSHIVGHATLNVYPRVVPLASSLHPDGLRGVKGRQIEVPLTTVDEVCRGRGRVDLVKIDVEGFAYDALRGMQNVLKEWHPILIVEVLPDEGSHPGDAQEEIQDLLSRYGYHFYEIREQGPVEIQSILHGLERQDTNVLCRVP